MVLLSSLHSTIRNNRKEEETHGGTALDGDFDDALSLSPHFDAGAFSFSSLGADAFSLATLELIIVKSD